MCKHVCVYYIYNKHGLKWKEYFDSSALKNIYAQTYIKKQPMKTL